MSDLAILGAHSFSGNSFISSLKPNTSIVAISRSKQINQVFNAILPSRSNLNITSINWNLNEDPASVVRAINESGCKIVVNFAAQSMVGQSWNYPEDWYEANVLSFSKFLTKIQKESKIEKFIQFTTPEVYGSTEGWIKESFNFAPNSPYAISRAAGDWHLKALHDNFGFPVIFTRAANVYGEHQQLYRIIPRVIISALTGKRIPLQGGGRSIRSFIHMDDVSRALLRIIDSGIPGSSYHISTNNLISIYDLIALIAAKLNVEMKDLVDVVPDRPGKDFAYQLDSQRIREDLGWRDEISLESGLDRTIEWVKNNLSELRELPLDYVHRR
jgi:dTDP-glucose 4,6-dehydratase